MITETPEGFDIALYSDRTFTTLEKSDGWTLQQAIEIGRLMYDAYQRGMSHGQTIGYTDGKAAGYADGWADGHEEGQK